jgi:hypothetical protein
MQLTDKQIEKFEQDGYLFFPNAFSTEEVGVLKQAAGSLARENRCRAHCFRRTYL